MAFHGYVLLVNTSHLHRVPISRQGAFVSEAGGKISGATLHEAAGALHGDVPARSVAGSWSHERQRRSLSCNVQIRIFYSKRKRFRYVLGLEYSMRVGLSNI